jgi:hypothetical protein
MLKGDALAAKLYDLFGPIHIEISGPKDIDLIRGLNQRGIMHAPVREGGVRFYQLGYGESAPAHLDLDAPHRYWAFYCNSASGTPRDKLDDICIRLGLERAPIYAIATPYDTLDKEGPWWAIYQRRGSGGATDHSLLSSLSDNAWERIAAYRFALEQIRPGDRVLALSEDWDVRRFIKSLSPVTEMRLFNEINNQDDYLFDAVLDFDGYDSKAISYISDRISAAGIVLTDRKQAWTAYGLRFDGATWQKNSAPRGFSKCSGDVEINILRKPYLVKAEFRNVADAFGSESVCHLGFEKYYEYPHVIQSLVRVKYRTSDPARLVEDCERILAVAQSDSADAGAALCVLSYASRGKRFAIDDERVHQYLKTLSQNPHVIRWKISLAFVQANSWLENGQLDRGLEALDVCLREDARTFHLSILTKQVKACIQAANILAGRDEGAKAAEYLRRGTELARNVCTINSIDLFGTHEDPRFYFFSEIGEVMMEASRCAFAYEMWRRSGLDGIRQGLAISVHIGKDPSKEDVIVQSPPSEALLKDYALRSMSGTEFIKFAIKVVSKKAFKRLRNQTRRYTQELLAKWVHRTRNTET